MDEDEDGPACLGCPIDVHGFVRALPVSHALRIASPEAHVGVECRQARVHRLGVGLVVILVIRRIEFVLVVVPPDMRTLHMAGQTEAADKLGKNRSRKEACAGYENGATRDRRRQGRVHRMIPSLV